MIDQELQQIKSRLVAILLRYNIYMDGVGLQGDHNHMADSLTREVAQMLHEQKLALFADTTDEIREYTDRPTGVYLIVERDNPLYPGHPKLTLIFPAGQTLSVEEVNDAVSRLEKMAGVPPHSRMKPFMVAPVEGGMV